MKYDPEGWAPLYRRLKRSSAWKGQKASTKVVAVWLILSIRHDTGDVFATLDEIGGECDLTRNTVRQALADLDGAGFCISTRTGRGLLMTVPSCRRWLGETSENRHVRDAEISPPNIIEEVEEGSSAAPPSPQKQPDLGEQNLTDAVIAPPRAGKSAQLEGYRETIDAFHTRYVAAYGSKPTWRAAEGAQLKKLLAAHGASEVQRRVAQLFEAPPRWLDPPFTFMTLVKNFDSLVPVASRATARRDGGMSPSEILNRAREMGQRR